MLCCDVYCSLKTGRSLTTSTQCSGPQLRTFCSVARSMTCICRLNKERNALEVITLYLSICSGNIPCMAFTFKLSPYDRKGGRSRRHTKELFVYEVGWRDVHGVTTVIIIIIIIMFWYTDTFRFICITFWRLFWMKANELHIWQHPKIMASPPPCLEINYICYVLALTYA